MCSGWGVSVQWGGEGEWGGVSMQLVGGEGEGDEDDLCRGCEEVW